jgi:hypothetical protein
LISDTNDARTNMPRDTSNKIVSKPKFVARITRQLNNGLRRTYSK